MKQGFLNKLNKQATLLHDVKKSQQRSKYADIQPTQKRYRQKTQYVHIKHNDQPSYISNHSHHTSQSQKQTIVNKPIKLQKWQRRFYLNQILQFIFEVADRNEVYRANFIHAHIPFVIVFRLLQIEIKTCQQTYLKQVVKVLINKIKQINLKAQLNNQNLYNQFMFVAVNPKVSQQQLLNYLRKFMQQNKALMKGFIPYYYNYFALVVNKQIVFNGQPGDLIQYTIDYKHDKYYNGNFTQTEITSIIDLFEKKLAEKYHCNDV